MAVCFLVMTPFLLDIFVTQAFKVPTIPFRKLPKRYDRFVQKIFDDADTNKDHAISEAETYELVLKLYILINRQAPINPPSRETVHALFELSDSDNNRRINRQEFMSLATIVSRGALLRVMAHKVITLFGAPLLATSVVRQLSKPPAQPMLTQFAVRYVPEPWLPTMTSPALYEMTLIILFVSTLGSAIMNFVDAVHDMSLRGSIRLKKHQNEASSFRTYFFPFLASVGTFLTFCYSTIRISIEAKHRTR